MRRVTMLNISVKDNGYLLNYTTKGMSGPDYIEMVYENKADLEQDVVDLFNRLREV